MAKGFVEIDIPESCNDCELRHKGMMFDHCISPRRFYGRHITNHVENGTKPDWCPINKFPDINTIKVEDSDAIFMTFDQDSCSISTASNYIESLRKVFEKNKIVVVPRNISFEFMSNAEALDMVYKWTDRCLERLRENDIL